MYVGLIVILYIEEKRLSWDASRNQWA